MYIAKLVQYFRSLQEIHYNYHYGKLSEEEID